jgi:hypothetical protein
MWRIRSFIGSAWTDSIPVIQSETPKDPSTLTAIELARSSLPTALQPLVHHLDEELEASIRSNEGFSASGTRNAIETWSAAAVREALEYNWAGSGRIEAHEEALALYPEGSAAVPSTLAWHDRTLVILPITSDFQEFSVEYSPSLRDENRVERLRHRYATPEHELETILDWRGYFGPDSAIIDGWKIMRRQGHSYAASLTGTFGFIVAHVVRRLTRPHPTLERDPTAAARLIQMSEAYSSKVHAFPDLARDSSPVERDHVVVFVHGTTSCGMQGLKDLPSLPDVIFRYEHDTFRPLLENSEELVELIQRRIRTKALLLVAHSRGGLVARLAADALVRKAYSAWIQVFTFGTPHNGTPLAAMGEEALNLLFKLSGDIVNGIPTLTPLGKAYSFLVKSPALPPGIAAMREGSGDLNMMNAYGDPALVQCWGSNFKLDRKPTGFGVFVSGMLLGAMNGIANDLVVPTQSALAFGTPQPLLGCSHTQYFTEQAVHQVIQNFFVAAAEDLKLSSPMKFKTRATGANG